MNVQVVRVVIVFMVNRIKWLYVSGKQVTGISQPWNVCCYYLQVLPDMNYEYLKLQCHWMVKKVQTRVLVDLPGCWL